MAARFDILLCLKTPPVASALRTLLLVEGTDPPLGGHNTIVVHWSTPDAQGAGLSIPALVDRMSPELKRDYLAWVHDLGNVPVERRPLKEFLYLEHPGLSGWWLNGIADKAPMTSPAVYQVFKLRILERLYLDHGCVRLVYVGRDSALHRTLKIWCEHLNHPYRWVKAPRSERRGISSARRLFRKLPHPVQAVAFLMWALGTRYVPAWLARPRRTHANATTRSALIVTYFPNIDRDIARQGRFRSYYWGPLHAVIDALPITPTWLWIQGHPDRGSFRQALRWRDLFNAQPARKERHVLIEEFATPRALLAAIRLYAQLGMRGRQLKSVRARFVLPDSTLNFYPVFDREWKSSLFGTVAMDGSLYRALFDAAIRRLPAHRWCLYIWENQPWESALLAAWRQHRNGPAIGYQHATLMPLELRSFCDPRSYVERGPAARPFPDILAINGQGALDLLRDVEYPEDRLAVVEALRYPRLSRRQRPHNGRGTLLIIGGYMEAEAAPLLRMLNEAAEAIRLAGFSRVLIKPHPFGPAILRSPTLPLRFTHEVVTDPLDRLWPTAEFALAANSTSAAVEALYVGVPLAICKAEGNLNLSPLYGHPTVPFVGNGSELAAAIATARCALLPDDYFLISETPERWKALLLQASIPAPR